MSRDERINKLANAVREYRGVTDARTGAWVQTPKPKAELRVARWLEELGIDADEGISMIRSFKTFTEFRSWLKSL